jgi:protein-S-isoprenylcysteine O-methyltransferase Ste14
MIIRLLFSCILTLELICTAMVIFSMLQPEKKIWPPKEEDSPGGILMQALFNLTAVGIILLGILDWGKTVLPVLVRILGGLTWLAGMALAVWAVICLGVKNTTGKMSGLTTKGPYRWTRNPQYLGFMASLIGWGMTTSSPLAMVAGLVGWVPLCLVPRIEEPWLLEVYGEAYQEYLQGTPRFLFSQSKGR